LAVTEAIEDVAGLPARLKWPNDVVLADGEGPEWHKVCGLLLDVTLAPGGERLESAIIGVGLNVNTSAAMLPAATTPATSLLVAGGKPVSRRALLVALLARLERYYDAALDGRSPAEAWAARLITLGRRVMVTAAASAEPLIGTAEGIDAWGQLLVRDDGGALHTVSAGDVTLRGR
jgi:BirA family biotin operon repressor/biotin-[acetyl-CoA-carboxylase] ligase